VTLNDLEPPK